MTAIAECLFILMVKRNHWQTERYLIFLAVKLRHADIPCYAQSDPIINVADQVGIEFGISPGFIFVIGESLPPRARKTEGGT
jgi:hypothetical protein